MNTALQQVADEIAFEFDPWRFDGKTGEWKLNGIATDLRAIIIPTTGKHYGILFDDEGRKIGQTEVVRYTTAPPSREYASKDWKPSTSVTGVIDDETKRLVTISMLTWSGRTAFARVISAFLARSMRQYPVCTLSSKLKTSDPHSNYAPHR